MTTNTDRIAALESALIEADMQLAYLDARQPSGTTPVIRNRISAALAASRAAATEPQPVAVKQDAAESESAGKLLERLGMDGAKWAAEFRATALRLGCSDMDEGWLIGWFCNAIMAGYDRRENTAQQAAQVPEVKALIEAARPYVSPVQNADFGRQMKQHEALCAALRAIEGGEA